MAFIARQQKDSVKIFQDVVRPDMLSKLRGMDVRQKLGFLQLQALVGMAKFDSYDKKGKSVTIETDSHGMVRSTLKKLEQLGYLENYEERFLKKTRLILPKLAFANTDFKKDVDIYNIKFQRTDKSFDFADPEFRKMFPIVFSARGLLATKGYSIEMDKDGKPCIVYGENKREIGNRGRSGKSLRETFVKSIKYDEFSLQKQKKMADKLSHNRNKEKGKQDMENTRYGANMP